MSHPDCVWCHYGAGSPPDPDELCHRHHQLYHGVTEQDVTGRDYEEWTE